MGCKPRIVVLGAILALLLVPRVVHARIWYIKSDGTGDAATIQAGIDSAQAGDEVVLASGVYTWSSQGGRTGFRVARLGHGNVLRGEFGPESTIIDGEYLGGVFSGLDVGAVRIENLTIRNGLPYGGGNGGAIALSGNSHLRTREKIIDTRGVFHAMLAG